MVILKTHRHWSLVHRQARSIPQFCSDPEETLELEHSKLSMAQDLGGPQSHIDKSSATRNEDKNKKNHVFAVKGRQLFFLPYLPVLIFTLGSEQEDEGSRCSSQFTSGTREHC